MKRTAMKRSSSTQRKAESKRSSTLQRRRLTPQEKAQHDTVREEVFRRDGYRCRLAGVSGAGRCFGPLTYHHRRKNGQGGLYTVSNGATLCAHHNDELEANVKLVAIAKAMDPPLVLDKHGADVERFWSYVDRAGPVPKWNPDLGACWLWTGGVLGVGYGSFSVNGATLYAHRYSLGLLEQLLAGLEVDHLCRVPLCVRPDHLEQVTPAENRRRQALARPVPIKCQRGHRFTKANTGRSSAGRRRCLTCKAMTPEERAAEKVKA